MVVIEKKKISGLVRNLTELARPLTDRVRQLTELARLLTGLPETYSLKPGIVCFLATIFIQLISITYSTQST